MPGGAIMAATAICSVLVEEVIRLPGICIMALLAAPLVVIGRSGMADGAFDIDVVGITTDPPGRCAMA